jgi:hypothetical protein
MKAKERSVVSFWWLCIPLYIIACLIMKSYFIPNSSLASTLHSFTNSKGYAAVLLFFILPFALILINLVSIRQLYFLYGDLTTAGFLKAIVVQILMILLSLLILLIYFL